jgi:hypothetical protein
MNHVPDIGMPVKRGRASLKYKYGTDGQSAIRMTPVGSRRAKGGWRARNDGGWILRDREQL